MTYSILIYDEAEFLRTSLELLISKEHPRGIIYVAKNIEELYELSSIMSFDLAIIDIKHNGIEEFSIIRKLKLKQPEIRILIYTLHDEFSFVELCLIKGANGVLHKNSELENLFRSINLLLRGENYFSSPVEIKSISKRKNKVYHFKKNILNRLSTRELEVAKMLVNGFSNTEIKEKLQLTTSTVSTFKKRLFLKTNVNNVIELSKLFQNMEGFAS